MISWRDRIAARLDFGKWFKTTRNMILEDNLKQVEKELTKVSFGPSFTMSYDYNETEKFIWMNLFKMFWMGKWKYTGTEDIDDWDLLDEYLWTWGRVAVVKNKGSNSKYNPFVFGNFKVDKKRKGNGRDYNGKPLYIKVYSIHDKKMKHSIDTFEVGKDAVIIEGSKGYLIGKNTTFGPYFKVNELIRNFLITRDRLLYNIASAKIIIPVPNNTSDNEIAKLNDLVGNKNIFVRIGDYGSKIDKMIGRRSEAIEIKEMIAPLINATKHFWNEVLTILGCQSNDNPQKAEQVNIPEVKSGQNLVGNFNETELNLHKKGIRQINRLFKMNISVELNKENNIPKLQHGGGENETNSGRNEGTS